MKQKSNFYLCLHKMRKLIPAIFAASLFAAAAGMTQGQSGRRITKTVDKQSPSQNGKEQPPTTSQTENKQPSPEPSSPAKTEQKKTSFIVANDIIPSNTFVRSGWAVKAFKERLAASPAVFMIDVGEMRRKDAIDKARSEEETFVVWLRLDVDVGDTENPNVTISPVNSKILMLQFYLFEPRTGKVKNQGHISLHKPGTKTGDITVGGTKPGYYDEEYLYKQAGREAADRVLSGLNLPLPKDK